MITVAQHCLRTMANDGVYCKQIAACSHFDFPQACRHDSISLVMCSPFGRVMRDEDDSRGVDDIRVPAVTIISRVISRPSFDWCVIDAGSQILSQPGVAKVLSPVGAQVLRAELDTSTLSLSEFALDLRIGDTVQLAQPYAGDWLTADPRGLQCLPAGE